MLVVNRQCLFLGFSFGVSVGGVVGSPHVSSWPVRRWGSFRVFSRPTLSHTGKLLSEVDGSNSAQLILLFSRFPSARPLLLTLFHFGHLAFLTRFQVFRMFAGLYS